MKNGISGCARRGTRPRRCSGRRSISRVHRIPPRARDDRETPLKWDGTAEDIRLSRVRRQALFSEIRNFNEIQNSSFPLSSLLPLWEKVARATSAPDEGFFPRRETPHPSRTRCARPCHPLPQGERGRGNVSLLPEFDLVADLVGQADAAEGQDHFGRQLLVALEAAA